MNSRYIIVPRPAELGGGWRLQLFEGEIEMGGGVFPPVRTGYQTLEEARVTAFSQALAEGNAWLNSRGRKA